jgi:hypothetical protein
MVMSDELERPKRNDEAEVEAHHNWKKGAGVEAGDEADGGDEVEAHHNWKKGAGVEAGDEADDGDDFEAHRHNKFA